MIAGVMALLAGCASQSPETTRSDAGAAAPSGGGIIVTVREIPATDLSDQAGIRILSALSVPPSPVVRRRVELVVRMQDGRIRSLVVPASAALQPGALLPLDE